jgi:hypothetical protein
MFLSFIERDTMKASLQVLTAAIIVFWDIAPCRLVGVADISGVLSAAVIRAMSHIDDGGGKRR